MITHMRGITQCAVLEANAIVEVVRTTADS